MLYQCQCVKARAFFASADVAGLCFCLRERAKAQTSKARGLSILQVSDFELQLSVAAFSAGSNRCQQIASGRNPAHSVSRRGVFELAAGLGMVVARDCQRFFQFRMLCEQRR